MIANPTNRRPIQARGSSIAVKIASVLTRAQIKPNMISVFSVVFAVMAGVCFAATAFVPTAFIVAVLFVLGALFVLLRLLCNLFDGMVAIEGGFQTKSGEVFNELPDRTSDAVILIGFGYAAGAIPFAIELGYIAAILAIITAYVRALGAATGVGQNFTGPMAKAHRMAVVIVASILSAIAVFWWTCYVWIVAIALGVIVLGTLVTIVRRTVWVTRALENKNE